MNKPVTIEFARTKVVETGINCVVFYTERRQLDIREDNSLCVQYSCWGRIAGSLLSACLLSTGLLVFLLKIPTANADQYLTESTVRIERHDRRATKYDLTKTPLSDGSLNLGLLFDESLQKQVQTEDTRLISYEALPTCKSSEYKLEQIFEMKPESWLMDIVYYSAEDRKQQHLAKGHKGISVAYEPALVRRPNTNLPNYLQAYARFLQINCLPTRFRYVEIGSKRYREFSSGEKAWSDNSAEEKRH